MALILNIDTALQTGSISLANSGEVLETIENRQQGQQAAWIHQAIKEMFKSCGLEMTALNAIAVSNGPGSYTGLRIGLSTAKGLCYTLGVPLICVNTLQIIASAVMPLADDLICPMIDARRMEVFTAIYTKQLQTVKEPHSLIITHDIFAELLENRRMLFTGDGCHKFKPLVHSSNAVFIEYEQSSFHLARLSNKRYEQEVFADLAYAEPEYVKAVYTT